MRAGGRILMVFGLVLGIIAAAATFIILQQSPAAAPEAVEAVPSQRVVVAAQTIEPWQEIPINALVIREYPDPLPQDAVLAQMPITDEEGQTSVGDGGQFVAGKISNTRIYPGQVLVTTQLIDKTLEEQRLGLGSTASYIVPEGLVATVLPIDQISSVAGALRSGDRVDIIATVNLGGDPNAETDTSVAVTQFLLQNVEILRVGSWRAADAEEAGNLVTILVEPQEALEIKFIREETRWNFVLRAITDEAEFVTEPVDQEFLNEKYNLTP